MESRSASFRWKAVSAAAAGVMAISLALPGMAFADDENDPARDSAAESVGTLTPSTSVATGAATRAAMPSLEILGINSVEESGQFVTMTNGVPQYNWEQPKYYLAASNFNSSPSTYLANLANSAGVNEAVYNASRAGGGNGPDSALDVEGGDATDSSVLSMLPTVIVGNSGGAVTYKDDGEGVDWGYTYEPGVTYSFSDYDGLIDTMRSIASVATHGRYEDSPSSIAEDYANYINNTIDYVCNNADGTRTVALVTNAVYDEDAEAYTYSLLSYDESGLGDGTASNNRYLETVWRVNAVNYADDNDTTTASASELASVDLILVGGQQSSSNYDAIEKALISDGLLDDAFFVEDNGSHGAMYGTIMNSVENAQNIGRILGCLYPELIDQDAFMVYYYENFYHINSSDVAYVMSQAMDGVRNWDATGTTAEELTNWTVADCTISETDMNTVEDIVDDGVLNESYLESDN